MRCRKQVDSYYYNLLFVIDPDMRIGSDMMNIISNSIVKKIVLDCKKSWSMGYKYMRKRMFNNLEGIEIKKRLSNEEI